VTLYAWRRQAGGGAVPVHRLVGFARHLPPGPVLPQRGDTPQPEAYQSIEWVGSGSTVDRWPEHEEERPWS
jgi:hypothetical protein